MEWILRHALAAAAQYGPIIPCKADKTPACRHGVKDATDDSIAVRRLFELAPSASLIGVATGEASGITVLDIDLKHDGHAWLEENFDRLPCTCVHSTPSSGFHLFFRHRPGIRNSAGRIAPGVDVRGEDGYVIVPSSPGYAVLCDAPCAPFPEWLVELIEKKTSYPRASTSRPTRILGDTELADILRHVSRAPEGQRNHATFVAACRFGEQVRINMIAEGEAIDLLVEAATKAGLDPREAERTARSGVERGGRDNV